MNNDPAAQDLSLAAEVGRALQARDWRLITAESCTGGLVAAHMTDVPGSSRWFEGAFVTYRLSAKKRMLGVPAELLHRHGAVSEPIVRAMAEGALTHSSADISVAITGVAGPEGGDPITPVGSVWFGWAVRTGSESGSEVQCVQTAEHHLTGKRQVVREAAVKVALKGVLELVS